MLATTLWFATVLAALCALLLDGAAGFARLSVHAAAEHALEGALHDALADYQARLAAAPDPRAGVPPGAGTSAAGSLRTAWTATPTTLIEPDCAGASGGAPDLIGRLQCHPLVRESRLSLRLEASVLGPGGEPLAERAEYLTLRVFAQAPFSAVSGREDAAAALPAGGTQPAHEGDVAGGPPATLLHVAYACAPGTGPSGRSYDCARAAPPDPDAALLPGVRWQNGNVP